MIPIPRQRNSREENAQIKAGEVPEAWQENTNELEQKDVDAKWTKKNGQSYYGYKNHIDIDVKHKLIRNYAVTDASVHDSQVMNELLDPHITQAQKYVEIVHIGQKSKREN
jgi:IS5 family transposase